MASPLDDRTLLVTGGTGSLGAQVVVRALRETRVRQVRVFSRDEGRQEELRRQLADEPRLRFVLGDLRDADTLRRACVQVTDVIHTAAQKQIPASEQHPLEAVKTNILGTQNLIDAARAESVQRVVALSTDKASRPTSAYGATKLLGDKLLLAAQAAASDTTPRFSIVRCGNLLGSRGSIVPLLRALPAGAPLPLTDARMTRFWSTLPEAAAFLDVVLATMQGGEIFVPKVPSMRLVDLADTVAPDSAPAFHGIRPGERLHEEMIGPQDAGRTWDLGTHYVILPPGAPEPAAGVRVAPDFRYASDTNDVWLDAADLRARLGG